MFGLPEGGGGAVVAGGGVVGEAIEGEGDVGGEEGGEGGHVAGEFVGGEEVGVEDEGNVPRGFFLQPLVWEKQRGRYIPRRERPVGQRLARSVSLGDPVFEELKVERIPDFSVHQETLHAPLAGVFGARFEWLLGIKVGVRARVADIFEELLESTHEGEVVLTCVSCDSSLMTGGIMVDAR